MQSFIFRSGSSILHCSSWFSLELNILSLLFFCLFLCCFSVCFLLYLELLWSLAILIVFGIFHWGFSLHFPNAVDCRHLFMCWSTIHTSGTFSWMNIQISTLLPKTGLFVFSLLRLGSCLCILDTRVLSDNCFANTVLNYLLAERKFWEIVIGNFMTVQTGPRSLTQAYSASVLLSQWGLPRKAQANRRWVKLLLA